MHIRIAYICRCICYLFWVLTMDRLNVNRWIIGHRFNKDFMIDYWNHRLKRKSLLTMDWYYQWSAWLVALVSSIADYARVWCCMFMQHTLASGPCCMSLLFVHAACPCCISVLHDRCCISVLHAWMMHVFAAWPCCLSLFIILFKGLFQAL